MLSVAGKQMASETARTIINDKEKHFPAEFQIRASKFVCLFFVRNRCNGSGLSLRITETQRLKDWIYHLSKSLQQAQDVDFSTASNKQSATPEKHIINHIFQRKYNKPPRELLAWERFIAFAQLRTATQTPPVMLMSLQFRWGWHYSRSSVT